MSESEPPAPTEFEISDQDLLDAIANAEQSILKAEEVADIDGVPIQARQVRNRLQRLQEQGFVASRKIATRGPVRVWWSAESFESEGPDDPLLPPNTAEVVDSLDLPGHGERLRYRQNTVKAVFNRLFEEESATKHELKKLGWLADKETYSTPESLWTNCLYKAVNQSRLFRLGVSGKEWELTAMGQWLKLQDDQPLQNDWDQRADGLYQYFFRRFWKGLVREELVSNTHVKEASSSLRYRTRHIDRALSLHLKLDEPLWIGSEGVLSLFVKVEGDEEMYTKLLENSDIVESSLDFEIEWRGNVEHSIYGARIRPVDVDSLHVFSQRYLRHIRHRFSELHEWCLETESQIDSAIDAAFDEIDS